jgi:hypothetical protein
MKVDKRKVFVPDLAGDIGGTPGKGIVRLTSDSNNNAIKEPKIISNVRFNEFQSNLDATHLIDRVSSTNSYSFQRGIPNEANRSVEIAGALPYVSSSIYQSSALTHANFAGSDVKMVTEYAQRALSLGNKYLPARTFVELQDASALRLSVKHRERTIMLRIMVDSSRTGATTENKAVLAIAGEVGAGGSTASYQINVQGRQGVSNGIQINSLIKAGSGANNTISTTANALSADIWYTVFFRSSINAAGDNTTNTITAFELNGAPWPAPSRPGGNIINDVSNTQNTTPIAITGTPRMYIGYGELSGGVNADYTTDDFVSGVHIAELAVWSGYLSANNIAQIASSHLPQNQYESGIDSRPVKRVQQIFDSMDSYPRQRKTTGKRLTDQSIAFNSLSEKNFGAVHKELMIYPEMIPARLYSGSGGKFHGASYFPYSASLDGQYRASTRIPLKENQFRDIRATPFENRLIATASSHPGIAHRETEILNKISVAGYETNQSITGSTINALGGIISPFNDSQVGAANVINEIAVPESVYPGLDQRLGDVIRIEIPIPTLTDAVMGVDSSQGRIASMAYYNFNSQAWDRKYMPGISGSNIKSADDLSGEAGNDANLSTSFWQDARQFLLNSCSIGFGGTSGFTIFPDEGESALMDLSTRARPTSMYGFPHTDQYVSAGGQTLKISDYIDGPFLLEKIAVEFSGEVEDSGPSSIATIIKTPEKWRQASQIYRYQVNFSTALPLYTTEIASGPAGVDMFFRSQRWELQTSGADTRYAFPAWGLQRFQLSLNDPDLFGTPDLAALTAQSHANPYPIFVGGSSRPAYAEFLDVWNDFAGEKNLQPALNQPHFSETSDWPKANVKAGRTFPTSVDRLFAIQDVANDPASFGGVARSAFRGKYHAAAVMQGSVKGAPDMLTGVRGYHTSSPTLAQYYNIPAGIFLPQIERAPNDGSAKPHDGVGRRDGARYGGVVKLLFGGISGLVTGSYTPYAVDTVPNAATPTGIPQNYYSSGSSPVQTRGNAAYPNKIMSASKNPDVRGKPQWMSRNYISFVDSFSIDSTGFMKSTTCITSSNHIVKGLEMYDMGSLPTEVGGAPFWRCDTFFLLHERKGKSRFIGGEADIVTAPEKQSFERLQGVTNPIIDGVSLDQGGANWGDTKNPIGGVYLPSSAHQSAVLANAYSDGLGPWLTAVPEFFTPIRARNKRIRIEETIEEFNASTRTTTRELITYAQITHFGYTAAEAVIPGAIIPAENYYASSSAVGGTHNAEGVWSSGMMKGTGPANTLLPVSRSFYSQAIKLGATNAAWPTVGAENTAKARLWKSAGAGTRTGYDTIGLLWSGSGTQDKWYTTSSDQAQTQYTVNMNSSTTSNVNRRVQFGGDVGTYGWPEGHLPVVADRGIVGKKVNWGAPGDTKNPMFLDPGAGSGNGLFWRFSEYDAFGDAAKGTVNSTRYGTGKPLMAQYRWEQWFENPVYGGLRDTFIGGGTGGRWQGFPLPFQAGTDYTGGTGTGLTAGSGVSPQFTPMALRWTGPAASGSHAGGKLNYMQIDWRYQCGTHYNSGVDLAPIHTSPGKRFRNRELVDGVAARALYPYGQHTDGVQLIGGGSVTGSDYIGSMISSASQPWHGTAITRSGFSVITSPTTIVPSGSHSDYLSLGSFRTIGRNKHQGGVSPATNIGNPAHIVPAKYASASFVTRTHTWLDAGLSRDLDVEVKFGFTHTNLENNNGIAGFTILTASTVSPPGDFAGRFNGDHKLRATFKEKRLLNAGKFRIVSDIKTQPASQCSSSDLFCHIAPAKRQYLVGTGAIANATHYAAPWQRNAEFGENSRFSNDRIWWRAYAVEGQFIGHTTALNWQTNVGMPPSLTSGRRFTAAIGGNQPRVSREIMEKYTSGSALQLVQVQVPQLAPGPGLFRAGFGPNQNFGSSYANITPDGAFAGRQDLAGTTNNNFSAISTDIGSSPMVWSNMYVPYASSSIAADKPKTSLYLLMPGDEIILGFQPSLHGSNRGINTIPTNVNVNPYGPWRDGIVDRQGIPTGSAYSPEWNYATHEQRPELVDSRGQGGWHLRRGPNTVLTEDGVEKAINNANMESLYEPRSSFTLKANRHAKLVLYGTRLRNDKHTEPPTTQEIRSNAVHEAIIGAPVVDQYQIEPTHAYTGSYIAHHITGSILNHQKNRFALGLPGPDKSLNPVTAWAAGSRLLIPYVGSIYDPSSPSFYPLGGPYSIKGEYIRRVLRPNARETSAWQGLQTAFAQPQYWPKAPSTSFSMGISGSIQRFVRLADDSEFYYDSFVPNAAAMFDVDLIASGGVPQQISGPRESTAINSPQEKPSRVVFNLGTTSWLANYSTPWKTGSSRGLNERPFWVNPYAIPSFPFEERYSSLKRQIGRVPSFGTTGSYGEVFVPNVYGNQYPRQVAGHVSNTPPSYTNGTAADGTFPTGSMAKVTAIRIADQNNDRNYEFLSLTKPYSSANAERAYIQNIQGSLNLVDACVFGFWKTEHGDRPVPTLGNGFPNLAGTGDYTDRAQIDHPSGWKYGLCNFRKQASSAVFRHDRYGQLRDMLEQRQYTKFYDVGDEWNPAGVQESAVSCIFVDGSGMPTSDPLQTSCLNVSQQMTSSVPYKEGETTRTFLFSRQLVTISPLVQSFTASPFLSLLS